MNTPSKQAEFRYLNTISLANKEISMKKKSSRFCGVIICVVVLFILLVGNLFRSGVIDFKGGVFVSRNSWLTCSSSSFPDPSCGYDLSRSTKYCSATIYGGDEGRIDFNGDWVLHRVLIIIRHGDRSSMHSIHEGSNSTDIKVTESRKYLAPKALEYKGQLSAIRVRALSDGNVKVALSPESLFQTSDYELLPGKLTTTGFMQHVSQGVWLRNAYKVLLGRIKSPTSIHVRSTNYERTIQVRGFSNLIDEAKPYHLLVKLLFLLVLHFNSLPVHYYHLFSLNISQKEIRVMKAE